MKAVKSYLAEKHPDQVEAFEKGAQGYAKKIVANFKDFEFVSWIRESSLLWAMNLYVF